MGFAYQHHNGKEKLYKTAGRNTCENFLWKNKQLLSFQSSSFETVLHMLNMYIIYGIESCATAVSDVSNLD